MFGARGCGIKGSVSTWVLSFHLPPWSSVFHHPANTGHDEPAETGNDTSHENDRPIFAAIEFIQNDKRIVRCPRHQHADEGEKETSHRPHAKRIRSKFDAEKTQTPRCETSPRHVPRPSAASTQKCLHCLTRHKLLAVVEYVACDTGDPDKNRRSSHRRILNSKRCAAAT